MITPLYITIPNNIPDYVNLFSTHGILFFHILFVPYTINIIV